MSRLAVITGASSGIGRGFAVLCARGGYDVHLVARDKEGLEAVKREIIEQYDSKVTIQTLDLSDQSAAQEVYSRVKKLHTHVEILINNAGFGDFTLFHKADWKKLGGMINVNIVALTHLTHLFVKDMVKDHNGRILNVASTAAFIPGPQMAVYHATKAFVLNFTEALAEELKDEGVSVTALCPGPTESGFAKEAGTEQSSIFTALGKLPKAEEVAEFGYNAMMDGKRVAIHGLKNRLEAETPRFAPRKAVSFIVNQIYGAAKKK